MTDEQKSSRVRIRIGPMAVLGLAAFAILAVTTLNVSLAQLATSPWPMFRHDLLHTGLSQYDTSANPGLLKWKFATAGAFGFSSPAIGANGTIYVGSEDGNLYAVNPNGKQKWVVATAKFVESSPAIGADGTIYIGSNDGSLYAENPDGTQKWAFITDGGIDFSSPAVGADGTIYIGSEDGNLYAVNPDARRSGRLQPSPVLLPRRRLGPTVLSTSARKTTPCTVRSMR